MTKTLPHDLEVEQALLACCLLDGANSLSGAMNRGVIAEMFFDHRHATVFTQLVDMLSDGKAIDSHVLGIELRSAGKVAELGGYGFIAQLTPDKASLARFDYFADRLKELYVLRCAIREATALIESCYAAGIGAASETLDPHVGRLLAISSGAQGIAEPEWAELVDEAATVLEGVIASRGLPAHTIIPFPWPCMDAAFNPMQRGQLVVIGARPSIGKSSLMRPLVLHAANQAHRAYVVTLEVNPVNVVLQMAASIARVGIRQAPRAHARDQADLMSAVRGLRNCGITISRRDRSIARILARARALHAKGALDILVVDHGLLVEDIASARADDLKLAIGRLTKGLKALAQELGIVCVLLWQLNRGSARDGNREPGLTDLKDSGALEEDADKVLFIHRPDADPLTGISQRENTTASDQPRFFQNVIQAKGRDDGTSLLSFYFERQTASFAPIERRDV